ncbi:unnamed protein product [Withania somnifera]
MDPLKKPSITGIVSFLKEKQSVQEKDSSYVQGLLMSCEKNFKNELEDLKKKFEEEKRWMEELYDKKIAEKVEEEKSRIEGRYKKIIAEKMEDYKEQTNLLYERIDELKNEKNEIEENLAEYKKKIQLLNERIAELTNDKSEAEDKISVYSEKFSDFYRRISRMEENMRKDGNFHAVQFKSAEKCSGKSRNEDSLPINLASERGDPTNPLACKAIVCSKKWTFLGENSTNPERSSKIARVVRPEQNSALIRLCEDKAGVKDHSELPLRISDKPYVFSKGNDLEMFTKEGRKWLSEDDLCSAFEKDPELCWNAVCALYRQQISENKFSCSMSQFDEMSVTDLGKYLTDGDPEDKLRRTKSEVSLNDHQKCKRLAIRYCQLLLQIYHSKKDHLFCPGAASEGGGGPLKLVCPASLMKVRRSLRSSGRLTDLEISTVGSPGPRDTPFRGPPRARD